MSENKLLARKYFWLLALIGIGLGCDHDNGQDQAGKLAYDTYCGSCHVSPEPQALSKEIWSNSILPRMGIRLGIPNARVDHFKTLPAEEQKVIQAHNLKDIPKVITDKEWEDLKEYVLSLAPDIMPFDSSRLERCVTTEQFVRLDFSVDTFYGSTICAIEFDEQKKELWLANFDNNIFHWSQSEKVAYKSASPVVDIHFENDITVLSEIGMLFPTNLEKGQVSTIKSSVQNSLLDSLRRPVQADQVDLNNDGKKEIIVAEYGNDIGGLSIFKKEGGNYHKQVLLPLPGAIKFHVLDMNGDGKLDIISLFAQGDESIFAFYQEDELSFRAERILRFPPEWGTSDMELIDFNHDGLLDIVTAHGDNADYSYALKSYHGVRIHINTGKQYEEKFFYPIYGSTKVIPYDYDEDGDIDLAVSSFFPDFDQLMKESFVYLENKNTASFSFNEQIVEGESPVRSLCLERADFDADGDQDLILGQFSISPQPLPQKLKDTWARSTTDITVMFNQLR